ncbi:hypothetical protein ACSBR2_032837 [Camellia fascicularis]
MSISTTSQPDRARELWRRCLASAFRTALACTLVGGTTLYGPARITRHLTFPAFSYVTVILIVTDATFGDTLRGSWLALYATVQGVGPAILTLWLIGPAQLTTSTTAVAVAMSAFVVAVPESTHLIAKRIALGQIVIVYVMAYVQGGECEPVMHCVHVAASTGIGVLACVVALLFPYPRLATCEVKRNWKQFSNNASERLELFVEALCAEDIQCAQALISQAKLLAIRSTKYLHFIKSKQESMQWERLPIKFLKPYCMNPGERLEELDKPLRGMEIALTSSSNPVQTLDQELRDGILRLEEHIGQTLKKVLPLDSPTFSESNAKNVLKSLQTLQTVPQNQKDLPTFFFLFCLKLLQKKSMATSSTNVSVIDGSPILSVQNSIIKPDTTLSHEVGGPIKCPNPMRILIGFYAGRKTDSSKQDRLAFSKGVWSDWGAMNKRYKRLIPALKCSLSLGLAVLFGLIYSKENGYWAGLPVAISIAGAREATFKVANVKAQGTVLGTVYGVLGCFMFQKIAQVRFLSLLPWFIFTSFLQQSRLYGQAGAISAVIGAVLILGRKNFGPPSEFAIARIVETFIGLSCSIMVEIVLQPTRGSTLAKMQLSKSLKALHECVSLISLGDSKTSLGDSQKKLKTHVNELKQFIGQAEVEPNFWFLPFNSACYYKLWGSLSKMEDLLLFVDHAIGSLERIDKLEGHIERFKKMICSPMKCFEEVSLVKSLSHLEKELEKKNIAHDIELGKPPSSIVFGSCGSAEDEIEKIISYYLEDSREVVDKVNSLEVDNDGIKTQDCLSLSALVFCMVSLVRETQEIEKGVKEIIQWENPSTQVNLHEISWKVHTLYK